MENKNRRNKNKNMDKEKKIIELKNLVEAAELSLQQARKILVELVGSEEEKMLLEQAKKKSVKMAAEQEEGMVIEGVFDGQNMVGADGKKYSVPANYASKSKLVEGDGLKLTILRDGTFVYKQVNPLERRRIIGELIIDEDSGEYRVVANNKAYKVLNASITYFKGEPGDRVTLLVPKDKESSWAAVENIFKPGDEGYVEDIESENSRLAAEQKKVSESQNKAENSQNPIAADSTEEQPTEAEDSNQQPAEEAAEAKDNFSPQSLEDKKEDFLSTDETPLSDNHNESENSPLTPVEENEEAGSVPAPADIIQEDSNNQQPAEDKEASQPQDIFEALEHSDTTDVKEAETGQPLENSHNNSFGQAENYNNQPMGGTTGETGAAGSSLDDVDLQADSNKQQELEDF